MRPDIEYNKNRRLPTEYNYKYQMIESFGGWYHSYEIITAHGAVAFHVSAYKPYKDEETYSYSAGIEYHYRKPPEYMKDKAPSHNSCSVLGGPACWHDGTSLGAESLLETWKHEEDNREIFFLMLNLLDNLKRDE